uniref:PRKCA-binding protein n=1 Tax=Meloidogyne incognita TaxID=6306 RepID=A0A914LN93_MELIC
MFDHVKNLRLNADVIEIEKDNKGRIGIAIGGGAPICPCLYIVQIFENTPAKKNGLIGLGDEIVSINGESVRGFEKSEVASLIKETQGPIKISLNRLQFDSESASLTIDILLKKFKHRFVASIDDDTADALGLSRAILCNDVLAKLKEQLEVNQKFYKNLIKKSEEMAKYYHIISDTQNCIGSVFSELSIKEVTGEEVNLKKDFTGLSDIHKHLSTGHHLFSNKLESLVKALKCHAEAAIPDVHQTLTKYLDAKYEYLAYCLRVKELEDEEAEYGMIQEPLPRMQTGNYEYRAMLRHREQSRENFLEKRKTVAVKIELLDERHVRELALQLKNLINEMKDMHVKSRDEISKIM